MSNEVFAERLGIGVRTVAAWHQKPALRPQSAMQEVLDTALEQASPAIRARFAQLVGGSTGEAPQQQNAATADAERRLNADPHIGAALDWLDEHAGWEPGTSRREVTARRARLDVRDLRDRGTRRGRIDQRLVANALDEYYRNQSGSHGRYGARYSADTKIATSILTCPDWLDLDCPLIPSNDRLALTNAREDAGMSLDAEAADHALERLAETLAMSVRFVDMPRHAAGTGATEAHRRCRRRRLGQPIATQTRRDHMGRTCPESINPGGVRNGTGS